MPSVEIRKKIGFDFSVLVKSELRFGVILPIVVTDGLVPLVCSAMNTDTWLYQVVLMNQRELINAMLNLDE